MTIINHYIFKMECQVQFESSITHTSCRQSKVNIAMKEHSLWLM